jgi:hypothetical protein
VIATGFLADSGDGWPAEHRRQETARFPRASPANRADPRLLPSHTFCVGTLDLASVSPIVRSISNSVRRTHPTVSANLRRKPPLIARRAGHHCAPLHLAMRGDAARDRFIIGCLANLTEPARGYGRRSLAETAVGCYKAIIRPKLRARILPVQRCEAAIATEVLNHMIRVAKPASIRAT